MSVEERRMFHAIALITNHDAPPGARVSDRQCASPADTGANTGKKPLLTLEQSISGAGKFAFLERDIVTDSRSPDLRGGGNVTADLAEDAKCSPAVSETGEVQSELSTGDAGGKRVTTRPSREAFTAAYLNRSISVNELCLRYRVSDTTVKHWARRLGLAPRPTGGYRTPGNAPKIVIKAEDNHCEPVEDGPQLGDPTPEQIAELTAYCRARNVLAMQTMEDEHCEHRQNGRCLKCQRWQA